MLDNLHISPALITGVSFNMLNATCLAYKTAICWEKGRPLDFPGKLEFSTGDLALVTGEIEQSIQYPQ